MKSAPLAVTGIGTISPLGEGAAALAEALEQGRSGLSEVAAVRLPEPGEDGKRWALRTEAAPGTGADWAGRIEKFDSSPYIPPMRARRLDRASRFAVAAAVSALRAAGLANEKGLADEEWLRDELAVLMGTSSAGSGPLTVFLEALLGQGPDAAPPFEFPNTVANAPASHVSIELGLKGWNTTLSHSEAVVAQALLYGRLHRDAGRARAFLAGAVDEWNPYYQLGYRQIGALRDTPEGGGGSLLSEGSTVLVIEGEEEARERGAEVLARVLGVGVGSAVGEPFRWVPSAPVLARVIRQALDDAGLGPDDVSSVFLAANGVEAMEDAEAEALEEIFPGRRLPASGVKGAVGERAASGALALAAAVSARSRGVLPPFAGGARSMWTSTGPSAVRPLTAAAPRPDGATLVVLYGFGGNYGAILVS